MSTSRPEQDKDAATGVETESISREKKDFEEEWFFLQQLYMQWKENDPEKHALYDKAINLVAPGKSLQYYQGVYHTLVTLHPIIDLVLNPQSEFKDDPQAAMTNILQLQLGHVVKLILDRWPDHLIPKITDIGKPRAARSRMQQK